MRGINDPVAGAELDAVEAVEAAADELELDAPKGLKVLESNRRASMLNDGGISAEPIPAKLGYQPTKDGLRLAWQVTIDDVEDGHLYEATVDAASGDAARARTTGPRTRRRRTRSTTGRATAIFEFPKQDPNDGPRTLVTNPADAFASPFGWHDTNGVAGPEFTTTQGNNAHAYSDRDNDNNPDAGQLAQRRADAQFDFIADYFADQPQSYTDSTVDEPLLLVQHGPRPHVPVRVQRGGRQLPGQQLRQGRRRRRRRALRGAGRLRHQQRQLLHAGAGRRTPADADVPVAGRCSSACRAR